MEASIQVEQKQQLPTVLYSSFFTRLAALMIDNFIIILPILGIFYVNPSFYDEYHNYINNFLTIASFIYLVIYLKLRGQTLGKQIFNMQVIREDNKSIGWLRAIVREVIGKSLSYIFLLGFFHSLMNKKRKTFHDNLVNTVVIQLIPLKMLQKWLRAILILLYPIIIIIILSLASSYNSEKMDFLSKVKQKKSNIVLISTSNNLRLEQLSKEKTQAYEDELVRLCKLQKINEEDCELIDLSVNNLKKMNSALENSILELERLEEEIENTSSNSVTF